MWVQTMAVVRTRRGKHGKGVYCRHTQIRCCMLYTSCNYLNYAYSQVSQQGVVQSLSQLHQSSAVHSVTLQSTYLQSTATRPSASQSTALQSTAVGRQGKTKLLLRRNSSCLQMNERCKKDNVYPGSSAVPIIIGRREISSEGYHYQVACFETDYFRT